MAATRHRAASDGEHLASQVRARGAHRLRSGGGAGNGPSRALHGSTGFSIVSVKFKRVLAGARPGGEVPPILNTARLVPLPNFALWHTLPKLQTVAREVRRQWKATLQRRSQRGRRLTWEAWKRQAWFDLPQSQLLHRTV